jgi:hypothetical protein
LFIAELDFVVDLLRVDDELSLHLDEVVVVRIVLYGQVLLEEVGHVGTSLVYVFLQNLRLIQLLLQLVSLPFQDFLHTTEFNTLAMIS